jgi:hypothetical protein
MPVSNKKKRQFDEQVKELKNQVEETQNRIKELKKSKKDNAKLAPYFNIAIAVKTLKLVNLYCQMNDLSLEILDTKNESYLNNGRKEIYNVFMALEEVFGDDLDQSLTSNIDELKKVHLFNDAQKLTLIQDLSHAIEAVVQRFGEKSKWKWSFVEFDTRFAILAKNIINFKEIQRNRDPRSKFYMERLALMRQCKDALKKAAESNQSKYELSTKVPGDMIRAINMLSTLRQIHVQFGEKEEAEKLKSGIDVMKQRLDKEEKEKEKEKNQEKTKK